MKRYGRVRRKHRQNKKAKKVAYVKRFVKRILLIAKAQALANLIRIRAQRKLEELRGIDYEMGGFVNPKYNPSELPPDGIIAKGSTEWSVEYIVRIDNKQPVSISDIFVADALKTQEAKHHVELKLTGQQYKMIFCESKLRYCAKEPAQNLPPEQQH